MSGVRTRTRLSTQARREQLLNVGVELFANQPYEDVAIEQVAAVADVSRGLLYHYFPTKRVFFAAVIQHVGEQMLEMTDTDPDLPVPQRVAAGLDAYLDYAKTRGPGFRAFHRAAGNDDPAVRTAYENNLARQEERLFAALTDNAADLGIDGRPPAIVRLAVRGWLAFVISVTGGWLDDPALSQSDVRDLCVRALVNALSP
ncbi:MAG TPA: TetR/AcrR family transcriptional regulator [Pseudonocardiaceae bacterium]|nr:TetR/AcrR family transcriptional regulator [Pseudonocardiaceae bacterium]